MSHGMSQPDLGSGYMFHCTSIPQKCKNSILKYIIRTWPAYDKFCLGHMFVYRSVISYDRARYKIGDMKIVDLGVKISFLTGAGKADLALRNVLVGLGIRWIPFPLNKACLEKISSVHYHRQIIMSCHHIFCVVSTYRIERHERRFLYCTSHWWPYLCKVVCWNFHNWNVIKTCSHFEKTALNSKSSEQKTPGVLSVFIVRDWDEQRSRVSNKDGGFQMMRKGYRKKIFYCWNLRL